MNKSRDIAAENKFTNHLAHESSPYLRQHAHNPVDWHPWTEAALNKARQEGKPIFLSIGYAACHWCHVMEAESFMDDEIAAILNKHFVAVKVDREQRPDLDQIYMAVTMAVSGSGGWPMTVFLTPELKPFFAGTYFPPDDRHGRPGFKRLITQIAAAFPSERNHIENFADSLVERIRDAYRQNDTEAVLTGAMIDTAASQLMQSYDTIHGGFGGAPKFPHPMDLSFLLKRYALTHNPVYLSAVEQTLKAMALGGIYDQIGGGFHRYATDSQWRIPHFEKMLYDNALLLNVYGEAFQLTRNNFYKTVVTETADFILRELTHPDGGFYSSIDADSEGAEGRYYIWKKAEINRILGGESDLFCRQYNVSDDGNFEYGFNILYASSHFDLIHEDTQQPGRSKEHLFAERNKRIRPTTDDKIITSWNGLTLSGLAMAYRITGDDKYKNAAMKSAKFIRDNLFLKGRLVHSCRDGINSEGLFLEDYAFLAQGLIDLYEITGDFSEIDFARQLAHDAIILYSDETGKLYLTPENNAEHFMRPCDETDGALPAPGSVLIQALLKLGYIYNETAFKDKATAYLSKLSSKINQIPTGMISAIMAYEFLISDKTEIALVGKDNRERFLRKIHTAYIPNCILIISEFGAEQIDLLKNRGTGGQTTAYICHNSVCTAPIKTAEELHNHILSITGKDN